jgi:hypothetical protein
MTEPPSSRQGASRHWYAKLRNDQLWLTCCGLGAVVMIGYRLAGSSAPLSLYVVSGVCAIIGLGLALERMPTRERYRRVAYVLLLPGILVASAFFFVPLGLWWVSVAGAVLALLGIGYYETKAAK